MPSRPAFLIAVVACIACPPFALGQQTSFDRQLETLDLATRGLNVPSAEIFARADKLAAVGPLQADRQNHRFDLPEGQKRVSRSPIDILMRRIGLSASEGFVEASLKAQPDPQASAIVIESGSHTLEDLRKALFSKGIEDYLEKGPQGYIAHRPIFVWSGAALSIGPQESLTLEGSEGAFIVNTGVLEIVDARLNGSSDAKKVFRPFLLTTFNGATVASGSEISGLGFSAFPESSGLAFTHQGLSGSSAASALWDNVFSDGVGVAISGSNGIDLSGNRFVDASRTAILVKAARDVRVADNIVSQLAGAHGIKVADGSSQIDISHNIIIGSPGNAIFVDSGATEVTISGNLVGKSRLTGISVVNAACVAITHNAAIANGSRGIAMRSVLNSKIEDNILIANGSAGLAISGQSTHAALLVSQNVFKDNRFGLSGTGFGEVNFLANDFDRQLPRIADGEFASHVGGLLEFAATRKSGEFRFRTNRPEGQDDLSQFSAVDLARCVAKKGA